MEKVPWWLCAVIITLIVGTSGGGALKMENFHVPSYRVTGEEADLFCYFRLERNRSLHSLKWFKDGMEILRFSPAATKNQITLRWVDGVSVDGEKSSMNRVHLKNLTQVSSGTYSCEVTEQQSFTIVSKEAQMTVLDGPKSDPELRGFGSFVTLGDHVQGNCTLRDANPLVKLEFFINNFKVEEGNLLHFPPTNLTSGKQQLTLGLDLPVEERHWARGAGSSKSVGGNHIELKCVASMESLENVWMRVKYIQQSNPTLRRKSPRRQASADPIAEDLTAGNETLGSPEQLRNTDCVSAGQLMEQIAELLIVLNRGLTNLTAIQAENTQANQEMLALRRQELQFLRELPRAPIKAV